MESVSLHDRTVLRALAERKRALATNKDNERILKMWEAQSHGKRETPTVRLLFSNFFNEVIDPRMQCEGEQARKVEWSLLNSMVGRELFDDDTPLSPTFDVPLRAWADPYGLRPNLTKNASGKGFHINPVVEDIEEDLDKFMHGSFHIDVEGTKEYAEYVSEILGDILPVRIVMGNLTGAMTNPLVQLTGMETMYMALYDSPEAFHQVMNAACTIYEKFYDALEEQQLLLPTNDFSYLSQESFCFTDELPHDKVTSTKQMWGFHESQEMTAASPKMYGEFVYPYMDRLVKRYGLLSYGCCERVDNLFEDYLSKWTNLRKLSVSPFNDENKVGELLRGKRIVYYSKPRAEYVTAPGPLDDEGILQYFKGVCEAASGCLFEIAQREVGTIYGDYERGRHYVELAKEAVDRWWKP